jgi:outer membrane protein OmpA-like peptidoglycan-associated protein
VSIEPAVDPQRPELAKLVERSSTIDTFNEPANGYFPSEWLDSDGDGITDILDSCDTTPLGDSVNQCGCPIPVDLEAECPTFTTWCLPNPIIRFRAIHFEFDSSRLTGPSIRTLYQFASDLLQDRAAKVYLTGHTDRIGSDGYNWSLSERRVETVNRYLTSLGVAESRIEKQWAGEHERVWHGSADETQARNRRVELFVDYFDAPILADNDRSESCPNTCTPVTSLSQLLPIAKIQPSWSLDESSASRPLLNDSVLAQLYAASDITMKLSQNDIAISTESGSYVLNGGNSPESILTKELISCGVNPNRIRFVPTLSPVKLDTPSADLIPYSRFEKVTKPNK